MSPKIINLQDIIFIKKKKILPFFQEFFKPFGLYGSTRSDSAKLSQLEGDQCHRPSPIFNAQLNRRVHM